MIAMRRAFFAVFSLLLVTPAFAFGTIEGLGQSSEHEKITRLGLKTAGMDADTMDSLAGKRGAFGAVGAPDRPDRGLMSVAALHCDDGDTMGASGYPQGAAAAEVKLRPAVTRCSKRLNRR